MKRREIDFNRVQMLKGAYEEQLGMAMAEDRGRVVFYLPEWEVTRWDSTLMGENPRYLRALRSPGSLSKLNAETERGRSKNNAVCPECWDPITLRTGLALEPWQTSRAYQMLSQSQIGWLQTAFWLRSSWGSGNAITLSGGIVGIV